MSRTLQIHGRKLRGWVNVANAGGVYWAKPRLKRAADPEGIAVPDLSAISANIGTITSGIVKNSAGTAGFNLTLGVWVSFTGSIMYVTGREFGQNDDLMEWRGPTPSGATIEDPKLDTLTIANSVWAAKSADGKSYAGGAEVGGGGGSGPSFSAAITGLLYASAPVGSDATASLSLNITGGSGNFTWAWSLRDSFGSSISVNNNGLQDSIAYTKTIETSDPSSYTVECRIVDTDTGETIYPTDTITFDKF